MATLELGFVLFPNLTQLDFTGPLQVMSRLPNSRVHIAAKTMEIVPSDCNLGLQPTVTFADAPQFDVLCVPGGFGVADALVDKETVDFIRRQGQGARYVTSVCTGAFLLGAAGLLQGKRATTHWGYTGILDHVGATYEAARVVKDGNVITAGGVTSGIDFGLTIVAEIAGAEVAEAVQLGLEYNPAPPFKSGHPSIAKPATLERVAGRYQENVEIYKQRLAEAAA